jgi:hypothetical protein
MEKLHPTTPAAQTNRTWDHLEDFVREHVQRFIQALLEEEVTELLGRTKSARRESLRGVPDSSGLVHALFRWLSDKPAERRRALADFSRPRQRDLADDPPQNTSVANL